MNRQSGDGIAYKVYQRNALDLVSVALKFATILKLTNDSTIAQFQDAIRSEFTEYSHETGMLVQINADGLSQIEQDQHRFYNKSDSCSITLTSDQLAFQTSDHQSRAVSMKCFSSALSALRNICKDSITPERYGVRYINSIDREKISADQKRAVDWSSLVEEKYLSIPGLHTSGDDTRYYCEVNSAMPIGRLIIRYGLLPAQSSQPQGVQPVVFRFDCDRFIDSDIDIDKLDELSLEFSKDIYTAFTDVSGSGLIDWMSAENLEEMLP